MISSNDRLFDAVILLKAPPNSCRIRHSGSDVAERVRLNASYSYCHGLAQLSNISSAHNI